MKNIKKSLLALISLLCVVFMTGCSFGGKESSLTPSKVVSNNLDSIKSGNTDDILNNLGSGIIKFRKSTELKELFPDSSDKMSKLLESITYKVNSESINGNEAVVNVTLNGPDISKQFDELMQSIASDIKSGAISIKNFDVDKITNKYDKEFSKSLDSVKNSERTMNIELEKNFGKWEIEDKNDICKLAVNIDVEELIDKYEGRSKK